MPKFRTSHHDRRIAAGRSVEHCPTVLAATLFLLLDLAVSSAAIAVEPAGFSVAVRATWTGVPLRAWSQRVSELTGVNVVVDRRVDPGVTVTLESDGEPLHSLLDRVATSAGAVVEPLSSTAWIVPRNRAGRATAAEATRNRDLGSIPAEIRRAAERKAAWNWPTAARPRDLVAAAADAAGLSITGLDRVPHDHLPATSLPPLQLAERLDLLLANYDLRIGWSATGGEIVPIEAGVDPHERSGDRAAPKHPRPLPRRNPQRAVAEVYSLRLEAPLGQSVSTVAKSLGLESTLDEASLAARGIAPGEIVRVDARDLSRDELLDAMLAPLGLEWTIVDGTLRVFAAPPSPADRTADPR